jgi:hypothetical protein
MRKQKEWNTIQHIDKANNFPHTVIQKLNIAIQQKMNKPTSSTNTQNRPKKWTVFTYYNSSVPKIPSMFKNTNIGIAFSSTNTIHNFFRPEKNNTTDQYTKSGIYKLTCSTCNCSYVGQIGRTLRQRYLEHVRCIRNNDPKSAYATHILNNMHEYGNINNNMTLLK